MPKRTLEFKQLPWSGGLNTSVDPGMIPPNQLVQADNILFDTSGTRKKRNGIRTFATPAASGDIIALADFWHEIASGKQQRIIIVKRTVSAVTVTVMTTAGVETTPTSVGTVSFTASDATLCHIEVVGNIAVLSFNGTTTPKKLAYHTSASVAEVATATFETVANSDAGDYIVVYDTTGQPWAVALDKTGADPEPTGALWTSIGAAFKAQADISGDTSAADVAATVETTFNALTGFSTAFTTDDSAADGTMIFTNDTAGFANDAVTKNADDTTSGGISVTTNTQGKTTNSYYIQELPGSPPNFSISRQHLGRLWTNDKSRPDYLHYSSTGNIEEWGGLGDSGGINDLGVGDGDPDGITAIMPAFKGQLYVAKRYRIYRITGYSPLTFLVEPISNSLGCVSHYACVGIEQDDVAFPSERGFHSLQATDAFGDVENAYLSADIQPTYQDDLESDRRQFMKGAYVPTINSVVFAVTRDGEEVNRDLYLFNIQNKQWYRWPNNGCTSISVVKYNGSQRLFLGEDSGTIGQGRILETQVPRTYRDFNTSSIPYIIKTGVIFPDQSVYTTKGFKKLGIVFRNKGSTELDVTFKIDDFTSQNLTYTVEGSNDLLGDTFILGSSKLAGITVLAPLVLPVDGYGRGFQLTIENMQIDEPTEIYGFFCELEMVGDQQESAANREAS